MEIAMKRKSLRTANWLRASALFFSIATSASMLAQSEILKDIPLKNTISKECKTMFNNNAMLNADNNQIFKHWSFQESPQDENFIRASGNPIQISGFDSISYDNIRDAANRFLENNRIVFADANDDLKITQAVLAGGVWYVRFSQYIDGVPVLNSDLSLRISPDAKVFYLNSSIKRNAAMLLANSKHTALKSEELQSSAIKDLSSDFRAEEEGIYIIPINVGDKLSLRFAQKYIISSSKTKQKSFSYVDMENGGTLWRQSLINDVKIDASFNGSIIPKNPATAPVVQNFSEFYVQCGEKTYQTDTDGKISADNLENLAYSFDFQGPWVKIETNGINACSGNGVFTSAAKQSIALNDVNSNIYGRTMFYHANIAHQYIKSIDPSFTGMDKQIVIEINKNPIHAQSINAYSDTQNGHIYFDGINSQYRYAESPSVLYHEYGHSVVAMLYKQNGAVNGMTNEAVNEAFADVNAAFMTDNPILGENAHPISTGSTYIRTIKNNMIYPDSLDEVRNDPHENGRILGGAYWDLKELIGLEKARKLAHFVKYSLIDDAELGLAFSKWFYETLVRDDNDNNLANGVPDADAIIKAFNKHNIGIELYLNKNFTHDLVSNTLDTLNPYKVKFSIPADNLILSKTGEFKLRYKVNNGSYSEITMSSDNGVFSAQIPPQKAGSIVYYYFVGKSTPDSKEISLTTSLLNKTPFKFNVGFEKVYSDDFNGAKNAWTREDPNNANTFNGVGWECAVPELYTYTGYGAMHPDGGHSGVNDKCWVTGAKRPVTSFYQSCLSGFSNLVSPKFDLSDNKNPIVGFWFYTSAVEQISLPQVGYKLLIDISEDGGATWKTCDSIKKATLEWNYYSLPLLNYIKKLNDVKIRIVADNQILILAGGNFLPAYVFEALIDDFEILKPIESKKTDVESDAYAIEIYPNPTKDILYINTNSDMSNASIELLDIEGRVVYNEDAIKENPIKIDCSNITKGAYFLKITNNGKSISKPVIISR
jgi:hypothetical protein